MSTSPLNQRPLNQRSNRWRLIAALLFGLTLALTPSLAEARAGTSFGSAGSSFGSRGARTFENNNASPVGQTMTSQTPGYGGYGYGGGSFFSRHPFLTGIFGGFLGSMLFGGGFFGHMLGGLFSLLVIGFLIVLAFRLLAGGLAGGGGGFAPRSVGAAATPMQNRYRGRDIYVGDADLNAFQSLHAAVQEAWGRGDLGRMRQLMTPEMLSYFSQELTRNASQGVQNLVSNVNLVKAELTESWEEGDMQYATAYLRWTALDYTLRIGAAPQGPLASPGALVAGDPRIPTESEEVWTFVRRQGGHWLLSAIQQA